MDDLISLTEIDQAMRDFMDNNSAAFQKGIQWKKQILSNEKNVFQIITLLISKNMQGQFQIFLLDIIQDFVRRYPLDLPLREIAKTLASIPETIISIYGVISKLGNVIGEIARLIYQNEHVFLYDPSNAPPPSRLVAEIFTSVFTYMAKEREELLYDKNSDISQNFRKQYLIPILDYSFNTLNIAPDIGVHIMKECINFILILNKKSYYPINFDDVISPFESDEILSKLLSIAINIGPQTSCEILFVILFLCNADNYFSGKLTSHIQLFLSNLLDVQSFFTNPQNLQSFCEILKEINTASTGNSWADVVKKLLLLISSFATIETYPIYFTLLEYSTFLFSNYLRAVQLIQNPENKPEINELLNQFISLTVQVNDVDPEKASTFLDNENSSAFKQLLSRLWVLADESSYKVIYFVLDCFEKLCTTNMEPNYSMTAYLLLKLVAVVLKSSSKCADNILIPLINSTFVFTKQLAVFLSKQFQEPLEDFPIFEKGVLSFLKAFVSSFYHGPAFFSTSPFPFLTFVYDKPPEFFDIPPPRPDEDPEIEQRRKKINEMHSLNQTEVSIYIFQRIWSNLDHHVFPQKTKKTIKKILEIGDFLECLMDSPLPQYFLSNYLSMPVSSITYYVLGKFAFFPKTFYKDQLKQSLLDNFVGKDDIPSLKLLFKILSNLFHSLYTGENWISLYLFFAEKFTHGCVNMSKSRETAVIILQFVLNILANGPNHNIFNSWTPHSFRFVRFICLLLINITEAISSTLTEIHINESIFQTAWNICDEEFSDAPITLLELHGSKNGLNSSNLKLHIEDLSPIKNVQSDDDAWEIVARILLAANYLLASPYPNFAIMEMYNDRSFFILFEKISQAIGKTSMISILSAPSIQIDLSNYIIQMSNYFSPNLMDNQYYWDFCCNTLKVLFLSHIQQVLINVCKILRIFLQAFSIVGYDKLHSLQCHFVLTLNLITSAKNVQTALSLMNDATLFALNYANLDKDFSLRIGEIISKSISDTKKKAEFFQTYSELASVSLDFSQDDGCELYSSRIRSFFLLIQSLPQRIMNIPELEHYFRITDT